ncbi:MAG TPA: bifunctional UDP-N-acetylglucosamine diphosphorylase/glucosamine-1-phosphate N-acetyltransferase GlmU [Terriglobia bacterium]|nr:bifunctional UDP-N-acetylglucosamine diphosphorylase/glucosamine-1-phosphate N-acetyltransferase GlmU [Terriglobia bacterium]
MNELRILILAAGKGTRLKSRKAKVLHSVGGATLVGNVLRAVQPVSKEILVVVGHQADEVRASLSDVSFVNQKEQLGTGHALMCAREVLSGFKGDILVLPGDVPLIRTETIREFVRFHREGRFQASVLTADLANPYGYGRIVRRNDSEIAKIVEHRDASADELKIAEINTSIYVFNAPLLFETLTKIRNNNSQSEYYLTDVIGILADSGKKIGVWKSPQAEEILGINTRQEIAYSDRAMRRRKCDELMSAGVTIMDPASTFIDVDVQIGPDSVVFPSVQIYGTSVIGEDVTISSFSRITNAQIGSRTTVLEGCIVDDSKIGKDVTMGPYARIRPGVVLEDKVKVGNFVEIKKSSLGAGSKAMHLAYIGDATIGKNVNIGAGVITVNYDGSKKYPTNIEDDAFIGSDSQLIAPIHVGKGGFVAAGSSITEDVPAESLAIGRGRQVNKANRAPHRKKKDV